jgi:hypothetical protein
MSTENDPYMYRTFRVEWVVKIVLVDQYGKEDVFQPPFYESVHPTREDAVAELERVTRPHQYIKGRRVSNMISHEYHDCYVTTRQTLIKEFKRED